MLDIGVSEDLINSDGRPVHPAVDLKAELRGEAVRIHPVAIPSDRLVAPGTADRFDILVLGDCSMSRSEILSSERIRMICRFGKGHDDIDTAAASSRGIVVTRVVKAGEDSMATGVIALILALAMQLLRRHAIAMDEAGNWDAPLAHGGIGLKGKVLGIVGYGRIGQAVAFRARSFGMKIVYYDPFKKGSASDGEVPVDIDQLMSEADFVSVNCPLTSSTRGLISRSRLSLMKPSAYLINTGRGAVVDEAALCDALRAGAIAGAALDVFASEPLPVGSPLRQAPNLLLTPHAIGVSDEMYAEYMQSVANSIKEFAAGVCPTDALNPEAFRSA
jgi:D-3-phosphoglycerate dehydrogenase